MKIGYLPPTAVTRFATGNEWVSLPGVRVTDGGLEELGFVHEGLRGCIALRGTEETPLLCPSVRIGRREILHNHTRNSLASYWMPQISGESLELKASATVFAPLGKKGFVWLLEVQNISELPVTPTLGWLGCWNDTVLAVGKVQPLRGAQRIYKSGADDQGLTLEFLHQAPTFAVSMVSDHNLAITLPGAADASSLPSGQMSLDSALPRPLCFEMSKSLTLAPNESVAVALYVGVGLEEVSASSVARNLQMSGAQRLCESLEEWLDSHSFDHRDEHLKYLLNVNSFYAFFYSQACAIDTEAEVALSGRSTRGGSSGLYRDRDAMRRSLPAVMALSWERARSLLIYGFERQSRNVGLSSRFMSGVSREAGIELDQVCAPVRALHSYVGTTGDASILFEPKVQSGLNTIEHVLASLRHQTAPLFRTAFLPSDEPARYPYVCFPNVLVWRILTDLSWLYKRIHDLDRAEETVTLAAQVKQAIWDNFVVSGPLGRMFAYTVDLEGNYELQDEPAGSLVLLSTLDFCLASDRVYKNTVAWIHSTHNPRSSQLAEVGSVPKGSEEHLSVLAAINSLLTARKEEALAFLRRISMDSGLACEYVDGVEGTAVSGVGLAACSAYMATGLRAALNAVPPKAPNAAHDMRPEARLFDRKRSPVGSRFHSQS